MLARSQIALGVHLDQAAATMYRLALHDSDLRQDAMAALRNAMDPAADYLHLRDSPAWKLIHLVLKQREDPAETIEKGINIDDIIENLCRQMRNSAIVNVDDVVAEAIAHMQSLVRSGEQVEESVLFLRRIGAYGALLQLYESGHVTMSAEEVKRCAMRALHFDPLRGGRPGALVAMSLGDVPAATALAGISSTPKGKRVASGIEALVIGWMRMQKGELKLAIEVMREGIEGLGKGRCWAALELLLGRALAGERKYKEGISEFEQVRMWAREAGDVWADNAANRGLVETAVTAHGRRSRQASMMVEEAAGSVENTYGILECIWTDALVGEIDCERMEELVESTAGKAQKDEDRSGTLPWEYSVLDSVFGTSDAELAAVGASRLGQMLVKSHGVDQITLERAQRWQMLAANLYRGLPNPFGQLGWIFEKMARFGNEKKMISRAIRCYEKAVTIDESHPLASRRLSRLLKEQGFNADAVQIARRAAEKNPKERWAHNVVGWFALKESSYQEAVIAFRNALRATPIVSVRVEEVLFGTDVGRAAEDNDLIVDVDSWRGLSLTYRSQGKIGPALACTVDALALIENPPAFYKATTGIDLEHIQGSAKNLVEAEKALLLQLNNQSEDAAFATESVLRDSRAPLTMCSYLCESIALMASRKWLSGDYSRAAELRSDAAVKLRSAISRQLGTNAQINPSSMFKRLGDILLEAVTTHPHLMDKLLGAGEVETLCLEAVEAYGKATHYSPWDEGLHAQDMAASLLRLATLKNDEDLARLAVRHLVEIQCEPSVLAMSAIKFAEVVTDADVSAAANQLAVQVAKSESSKKNRVALNASIAVHASQMTAISNGAENAVTAIREDPADWRGWFAVAAMRESDAKLNGWSYELVKSSEEAFKEADRLGGGPCAVHGVVRCLTRVLKSRHELNLSETQVYEEACFCASMSARVGLEESVVCREIIDHHLSAVREKVRLQATESLESNKRAMMLRHIHIYPFIPEIAGIDLTVH